MSKASDFFKGGGGIPVNGLLPIATRDNKHISSDSTEWLRTGVVETDIASYPDAFVGYEAGINPTGNWSNFDVGEIVGALAKTDVTYNGIFFYVLNEDTGIVYVFNPQGEYGFEFSVITEDATPKGLVAIGTDIWVLGATNLEMYKYKEDGAYTGVSWDITNGASGLVTPTACTYDSGGANFYIVCDTTDKVAQFDSVGGYTSATNDVAVGAEEPTSTGLAFYNSLLYVIGSTNYTVFEYNLTTGYTSNSFLMTAIDATARGLEFYGTNFWLSGNTKGKVYKLSDAFVYKAPTTVEEPRPRGIEYDDVANKYYIVGIDSNRVHRYSDTLVYDGFNFDVSPQGDIPRAVIQIGTSLWVLDTSVLANGGSIFEYDATGVYQNNSFDVSAEATSARDMCTDGNHFYVLDFSGTIYQYDLDGIYRGLSLDISAQDGSWTAIEWDDSSQTFWVIGSDNDEVFQYDINGVYTGNHFPTQSPYPVGLIVREGTNFEIMDKNGAGTVTLTKDAGVGLLNATDHESGLRYYVRIK